MGNFFFLIPSTRLAYYRYHWLPLLHPPPTIPCGMALEKTRYLFKCLCRFNFQPLYGGQHVFIAIYLMIDTCSHLLFRDAVGFLILHLYHFSVFFFVSKLYSRTTFFPLQFLFPLFFTCFFFCFVFTFLSFLNIYIQHIFFLLLIILFCLQIFLFYLFLFFFFLFPFIYIILIAIFSRYLPPPLYFIVGIHYQCIRFIQIFTIFYIFWHILLFVSLNYYSTNSDEIFDIFYFLFNSSALSRFTDITTNYYSKPNHHNVYYSFCYYCFYF
ncbi:unnamed protein product [Acanthosepion pharaonis]|uniref:Uncharacterized protein n=1 Tax=Acanthosepion pharaonis TaxID=158019 RepID=A0A812BT71_ACAPH|nr:unnamed protein product [Sepia pharaonis]